MADPYLTTEEATALIATLPAVLLGDLVNQEDEALTALLLVASDDIDTAMKYQGSKYLSTQEREFPRVPYPESFVEVHRQYANATLNLMGGEVWDWDATTNAAVVPAAVKLAVIWQAAFLLVPGVAERLAAIRSGLTQQGIGTGSESYDATVAGRPGANLDTRAFQIMDKYRLRSGQVL